jgi:iron complex transport system substrate-binding protein
MLKHLFRFAFCAMFCCTFACNNNQPQKRAETAPLDTLKIEFARGFSVAYYADYKKVTLNTENRIVYYLVKNDSISTPPDGTKIIVPLARTVASTAPHYAFLDLLGEANSLIAVCSPQLVYNQTIRTMFADGKIVDLGDALQINVEKTLQLRPSAVIMSGYNSVDVNAERIAKAGIPVIFNNEWQESNVLGRAEWLKFVATFFDREATADSIFAKIADRYNSAKNSIPASERKPKVMSGGNFRGTWYMPGGQSYMAQLFGDAGADYFYENDKSKKSLPLNFETVLKNFADADFWVNCDYVSFAQMLSADKKNLLFKPAKQGNVWNFNKRTLSNGANDFWESGVVRPDLLLLDLIYILHGQNTDYQTFYAKKLE